ncbi:hypothetical protein GCM10023238_35640 [Streptomyces heliomycini]
MPVLRAVPDARRPATRVRDVAVPLERCVLARPDEMLTDLLERAAMSRAGPVLVVDHHHVVGVVTGADLAGAGGRHSDPRGRPPPDARAGHGR